VSGTLEHGSQTPVAARGLASIRVLIVSVATVLLLVLLGAAGVAYYAWFSQASVAARDLPIGVTAQDVAAKLGPTVYEIEADQHVLTCAYRFSDGSVLRCAFATRDDVEHYSETEWKMAITGTTLKSYQNGTVPGPFWDMPTYDFLQVPQYGLVPTAVDKTRTISRWVLGGARVAPQLSFGKRGGASALPLGPGPSFSTDPGSPFPVSPLTTRVQTDAAGAAPSIDYSRGHHPKTGSAERKALMNAARKRLHTKSQFLVKGIVVAEDSAVADLKPVDEGPRRLVVFTRRDGAWIAVSDEAGSAAAFEKVTGITPDTEVTGEL
jgi:hypothetical protein